MSPLPKELYEKLKDKRPSRHPIIHVLNVRLSNLPPLYIPSQQDSEKYIIAYREKMYRVHSLLFKIDRSLVAGTIKLDSNVDINAQTEYRASYKRIAIDEYNHHPYYIDLGVKPVVRIIPTRHPEVEQLYASFMTFIEKHTSLGGHDEFYPRIPECPVITTSEILAKNSIDICYKRLERQYSGYGTHFATTYIFIARKPGTYTIGQRFYVSNSHKTKFEEPVHITI